MVAARRRHRGSVRAARRTLAVLAIALVSSVATGPARSFAHTPHDDIVSVVLSPTFARDQTVLAISDNRVLRSTDAGAHWIELVRGLTGTRLADFAIAPSDKHVVYLSSRGAGVYRSDNEGSVWKQTTSPPGLAYATGLAVSPESPDVVVAAAGLLGGLYRTDDGGKNWSVVTGVGKVGGLTFVPGQPGHVVAGDAHGRLLVSHDTGRTFHAAAGARGTAAITAIAVSRTGSGGAPVTLFAGTAKGALLRSDDSGESWSTLPAVVPGDEVEGIVVSSSYATDHHVWASTWHRGTFRSTDGGAHLVPITHGLTSDSQADLIGNPQFRNLAIAPDASGHDVIYLGGYDGLFRSDDGGSRWKSIETQAEYVTGLAVSPDYAHDGTVVVNTYVKGVYVSRDRGRTFSASDTGLEHALAEGNKLLPLWRMHNVVFSPDYAHDHTIFTATWVAFVRSTDGGRSWHSATVSSPPAGSPLRQFVIAVSPDYAHDHTVYLGTRQGDVYRSTRGGVAKSWTAVTKLAAGVRSIVISPGVATDHRLYASTAEGIVASTDDGATWHPTGPPGIALLAMSPRFPGDGTVFAGTEHGLYATRDRGASWSAVAVAPGSTAPDVVAAVACSPDFGTDGTVLVSLAGRGLYRSTDGGRTFRAVGATLLARGLVIADFNNPTSEPLQFSRTFATDHTVYAYAQQSVVRSTDGGTTWAPLVIPPAAAFGASAPTGTGAPAHHTSRTWVAIALAVAALAVAVAGAFVVARRRRSRMRVATAEG